MSTSAWFLGAKVDVKKAQHLVNEALSILNYVKQELINIDYSLMSGALERDFGKLHTILTELHRAGVAEARGYSNRAHLLAEYARALRVRVMRLGTRGLSEARDEILRNLDDIESFIKRVQAYLQQ